MDQQPKLKATHGPSLLNKAQLREYILSRSKELRAVWHPERVSAEAIDMIEYKLRRLIDIKAMPLIEAELRQMLDRSISQHPTKGVTFQQVL
ncbi:MAG: hypothetical protein A2Y76_01550 [Planctomycetes bacterium RBG_13_60_9]|nr:MAG: hypothetical protein A2Y76_01550 [Planctomycetes bacterium RBG_13_60_9]